MSRIIDDVGRHLRAGGLPSELPVDLAYIHMGMYLGWVVDRDLNSRLFLNKWTDDVVAYRSRQLTGSQLVERIGGAIDEEMLNEEAGAFTRQYYSKVGRFFPDYAKLFKKDILASETRCLYQVRESWDNHDKIADLLDVRLNSWRLFPRRVKILVQPLRCRPVVESQHSTEPLPA